MGGPPRRPPPHGPRRRRAIAPEDRALWREVVRDATPLDPPAREPPADPETPPASGPAPPAPAAAPPRPPLRRLRPTGPARPPGVTVDLADRDVAPVGRPEAGLDRRNAERLRRGEREPDARVDLHGMTAERAHRTLDRCIGAALASGARLVLVITGKGGKRRDPNEAPFMRGDQGVLRQQVPVWIGRGPHARHIVGVYQAHPRHGGAGALYVYLKKQR
jgi:DNA-nicking Smr family endonuclease